MESAAARDAQQEALERFTTLSTYLQQDPDNIHLRLDAAEAAFDAGRYSETADLADFPGLVASGDLRGHNLAGLAALKLGRLEDAAAAFSTVIENGVASPNVHFNLAWTRALLKEFGKALEHLDAATTATLPQAATLEVQILHQEGRLEEALAKAHQHLTDHPDDPGLNAAVSVLAIDMEDAELAAACAARAGDHPDALTSLATLQLGDDNASSARALFDRALEVNKHNPRAWVGRGLARLMTGEANAAPVDIDQGAELFGTHLGSWIAAGWAHFIAGDHATARARFERALTLDPTFAESHGGLAVIDVTEGKLKEGGERAKVALRLDRECYGAALARSLLASSAGNPARAKAILNQALITPIDGSGRTIAQSLARMGLA